MRTRIGATGVLAGLIALDMASPSLAQTPLGTAFTYQGRLADAGAPANGAFDLQFVLFDAAVGGSQVGPIVTRDDVVVTQGLFTVALDFGAVFGGSKRWLEIGVRPGGSGGAYAILSPRQELTASPGSLFSSTTPWAGITGVPAGFADGVDDDTTYSAGAGISIVGTVISVPTNAITSAMIADSTVTSADIAPDTITAADIATNAVGTSEILNGTIVQADIATPAPAAITVLTPVGCAGRVFVPLVLCVVGEAGALPDCDVAAVGTICEYDAGCDQLDPNLNNCASTDMYMRIQ